VARALRNRILSRELEPGDRLPTFSQMREQFGVAANTTDRVFSLLAREGIVERRTGSGIFVSAPCLDRATGLIGFVTTGAANVSVVPYWADLLGGARQAASEAGKSVVLLEAGGGLAPLERIEGFLETSASGNGKMRIGAKPVVGLLEHVSGRMSVVADEAKGIREVVQHLWFHGHRRIAYLHAEREWGESHPNSRGRVGTFVEAMREVDIQVPPSWTRLLHNRDDRGASLGRFDEKAGFEMRNWLADGWFDLGCTALICQNDNAAIGAMGVLREAGISIPGDVSVVGFDGTEISRLCTPALTTVELPLASIGRRGMELLLAHIERDEPADLHQDAVERLPVQLRVRASTGPAT